MPPRVCRSSRLDKTRYTLHVTIYQDFLGSIAQRLAIADIRNGFSQCWILTECLSFNYMLGGKTARDPSRMPMNLNDSEATGAVLQLHLRSHKMCSSRSGDEVMGRLARVYMKIPTESVKRANHTIKMSSLW